MSVVQPRLISDLFPALGIPNGLHVIPIQRFFEVAHHSSGLIMCFDADRFKILGTDDPCPKVSRCGTGLTPCPLHKANLSHIRRMATRQDNRRVSRDCSVVEGTHARPLDCETSHVCRVVRQGVITIPSSYPAMGGLDGLPGVASSSVLKRDLRWLNYPLPVPEVEQIQDRRTLGSLPVGQRERCRTLMNREGG